MYSTEQRRVAIETFIKCDHSYADTIAELEYPDRHTLRDWWRERKKTGEAPVARVARAIMVQSCPGRDSFTLSTPQSAEPPRAHTSDHPIRHTRYLDTEPARKHTRRGPLNTDKHRTNSYA